MKPIPRALLLLRSKRMRAIPRDWGFSEDLQMNISADGSPAVLSPEFMQTQTVTEVKNETTDQD